MVEELGIALEKALEHYVATHPPTNRRVRQLESVITRNARAWHGQQVYVGRSKLSRSHPPVIRGKTGRTGLAFVKDMNP
jgi:hypothetical protein